MDINKIYSSIILEAKELMVDNFKSTVTLGNIYALSKLSDKNIVLRINIISSNNNFPKSIILKQLSSKLKNIECYERFAREVATYKFLNNTSISNIPKFYGFSQKNQFILIEDLGLHHISLVDSLLDSNKEKAIDALERFMLSLAGFHKSSFGKVLQYQKILTELNPTTKTWEDDLNFTLKDLLSKVEEAHELFDLKISEELIKEIKEVIDSIFAPSPFTVLTHGDICPDNVFDINSVIYLIDFEWVFSRNALLDATYLRMSMPSCWCAKSIPSDIIDKVGIIYRKELMKAIFAAQDDLIYSNYYNKACAFWMLDSFRFLKSIWQKDKIWYSGKVPKNVPWIEDQNLFRPRIISRLKSFIHVTNQYDNLPHLRIMAINILDILRDLWDDSSELELYPAFKP